MVCALLLGLTIGTAMNEPIPLWPEGNPGGWSRTDEERIENPGGPVPIVHSVSRPTLQIFESPSAEEGAPMVLVCPGGGYNIVAIGHEGWDVARFLNDHGIHAAVLKYRIPRPDVDLPKWTIPLEDAQRAMKMLRERQYRRVGVLGFSAGGHLSALTASQADSRPDFTVLIYPAYLTVEGTLDLSNEIVVNAKTPPAFLVHTLDDPITAEATLAYTAACKRAGVPVEAHLYPSGGHGYGLNPDVPGLKDWPTLAAAWILRQP